MSDNNYELNRFESLQINLASTEKILEWSRGEVTKPETINYRTLKPEKEGLFCERIFGPTKDWECNCGKYKRIRYKGIVCDRCGVEVTKSKVRRERMGHISLAAPVSHIWYFKGIPSRMGLILDITPRNLERVLYFASYIVLEPGDTALEYKQILSEQEYRDAREVYGNKFEAKMGAEAIRKLLCDIDLDKLSQELRESLVGATGQKKIRLVKRLEVTEALKKSKNRPEWMILEVIPVIPPELRPMVQLDGGRFATSDLNDLYRRVINRNNRLKRLMELGAPDIIVRNEKRMLQEAVDSLIDNGRRGRAVTGPGSRALKSLSDMLKGKQGRFRQNLLGKRVDYSGRSVIVVGPELRFWQCGLPKKMALELFKPFIMKELVESGLAHNIKSAKRMVEKLRPEVWDVLDDVIKDHPVMLNRAPTLHRLGIQAFEPVLVDGKAIKLHPLVCTAFNADFDGDQMAVHVPLSVEAQAEARYLMLSVNNILAPKDGSPITTPTQDMILGAYYLTFPGICRRVDEQGRATERIDEYGEEEKNKQEGFERVPEKGDGKVFADLDEMLMAYQNKKVSVHAKVGVRMFTDADDQKGKIVKSTVGRFIYNQGIYQDLGFVDREKDKYSLEVDFLCKKKNLESIIDRCYRKHGNADTAIMLDYIKDTGYHYSTIAAVTIGIADMEIPEEKETLIKEADRMVELYEEVYEEGQLSEKERYKKVVEVWKKTTEDVANSLMDSLDERNNLRIMANSGARGNRDQIKQVGGMRGLMQNAKGEIIEIPVKSNFREGLSILEYFISSNAARKGLTDTALRTADSGYLTRRLVDVSHNIIVREEDCGTDDGISVSRLGSKKDVLEALSERIEGRTACEDILNPQTGEFIVRKGDEITEVQAKAVESAGIETVKIRSALSCKSKTGVCAKCYGRNLATREHVNIGESVGIIAAQSIGEPGTQLTMRTFHTGGLAGGDITQGLPRVEELFEARKPKGLAEICRGDGTVKSISTREDNMTEIIVKEEENDTSYVVPYGARIDLKVGDQVRAGGHITGGSLYPQDILAIRGARGVHEYILEEVQKVYRSQGVDISDKHIEVIVSRMLSRVKIENAGDSDLLEGTQYDKFKVEEINKELEKEGKEPIVYSQILLGITKAALATESFLSAASFQETTRVLTDAAVRGKIDHLAGLKENVIIGKLIPAGTGVKKYKNIEVDYGDNTLLMENYNSSNEEYNSKGSVIQEENVNEEVITTDDTTEETTDDLQE